MNHGQKEITFIINPTNQCNLSCRYCYSATHSTETMDTSLVESIYRQISISELDYINIIWHGNEPLLAGLSFFENVIELQKKYLPYKKINNKIQTNGTLLNDGWAIFLKNNNFSVGLSIDGPASIHDANRVFPSGAGSHSSALKSLILLKNRGIRVGGLATITQTGINAPEEIYNFFKLWNTDFSINPVFPGVNGLCPSLEITNCEYGDFLIKLFELWYYDEEPSIKVTTLDRYVKSVLSGKPGICTHYANCIGCFVSINCNGDVFPCNRLSGTSQFQIGNLNNETLDIILSKITSSKLNSRMDRLREKCSSCEFFNICNSGCLSNSYFYYKSFLEMDYFCMAYKKIFKCIIDTINNTLLEIKMDG